MAPGDHKRCGKCGYDLTGLPGVGECPECGAVFNRFTGEGVEAPGTQASDTARAVRRIKLFAGVAFAVFLIVCSGVVQLVFPQRQYLVLGCVFAVIPLLWAITSYMDDKN